MSEISESLVNAYMDGKLGMPINQTVRKDSTNNNTLTKDNYFSLEMDRKYLSVSQFKSFDLASGGCEAAAVAKLKGEYVEPTPDAFLAGSYVHAWSEGTLKEFIIQHPEMFTKSGTLNQTKFKNLDKCIETLKNDPFVMQALDGQKEVIMTAEIFGAKWKGMFDVYNPQKKMLNDLKVMRSIHEKIWNEDTRRKENFIDAYNYWLNIAVYLEIERLNRGGADDDYFYPHIIAVSKEDEPDKEVIYLGNNFVKEQLEYIEVKLPHILDVKEGREEPIHCGHCNYCRSVKKLEGVITPDQL
jgi:hypothetical protein